VFFRANCYTHHGLGIGQVNRIIGWPMHKKSSLTKYAISLLHNNGFLSRKYLFNLFHSNEVTAVTLTNKRS